jgi:hypothetical protein
MKIGKRDRHAHKLEKEVGRRTGVKAETPRGRGPAGRGQKEKAETLKS